MFKKVIAQAILLSISILVGVSLFINLPLLYNTYGANYFICLILISSIAMLLAIVRNKIHSYLGFLSANALNRFKLYDPLTYSSFLLALGLFGPFEAKWSLLILACTMFVFTQLALLALIMQDQDREKIFNSNNATPIIFLLSGFAALIYQIIWQKELLSTYGVNSETVTIIVAVFMAGLGLGALSSNLIAKLFNYNYLRAFLFIELLIGIYGIFSLDIINLLAVKLDQASLTDVILQSLLCILFPTFLMGATLPILVSYLTRYIADIGKAVGRLYAFNTFGSAIAALLTVSLILVLGGKKSAILIAVGFNFLTAWLVYIMSGYLNKVKPLASKTTPKNSISLVVSVIIAFLVGYIALSQEMVWFRIADFSNGNSASTFGLLLSLYLTGIGFGSLKAEKIITESKDPITFIVKNLLLCFIVFYFIYPTILKLEFIDQSLTHNAPYFIAAYIAYLTGAILPLIAQITKESQQKFNYIYAANIVGAVLGSIITGYYAFEYLGIANNILLLSYLILAAALFISLYSKWIYSLAILALMASPILTHNFIYKNFLEQIQYEHVDQALYPFEYVVENRHGIITVVRDGENHLVYGGGVYDGKFNTSFTNTSNTIFRAYTVAMLHPAPKNVLVIGLSSGSWVKVFGDYQPIEKMDIIELNKGYLDIIKERPDQESILANPKNSFYFDDGALWLKKTDKKYDFILMNTTWYWRNGTNNLLSKEFLELAKSRLAPGGVLYFNTTNCSDIPYTAGHVFKYILKIKSFIAVSDSPFNLTIEKKTENLSKFVDKNQKPLIDFNDPLAKPIIDDLIDLTSLDVREEYLKSNIHHWLITKDNLANEFKYDQHFYRPKH